MILGELLLGGVYAVVGVLGFLGLVAGVAAGDWGNL